MKRLIYRQFTSYSFIGIISISLDLLFYFILHEIFSISKSNAKIFSFIIGSTNSFIGNKIITFKKKKFNFSEPLKFVIIYSISLTINSMTHDYLIDKINGFVTFTIATLCSVIINFLGQKLWVFKIKK